jgi:hypothetical protein
MVPNLCVVLARLIDRMEIEKYVCEFSIQTTAKRMTFIFVDSNQLALRKNIQNLSRGY